MSDCQASGMRDIKEETTWEVCEGGQVFKGEPSLSLIKNLKATFKKEAKDAVLQVVMGAT